MASVDDEVRLQIYSVLDGTLSLDEFETWFVSRTWDERTPVVAEVDHVLAEAALLTPDEIRGELRSAVATIEWIEARAQVSTASASETLRPERIHLGGTETIRRQLGAFAGT